MEPQQSVAGDLGDRAQYYRVRAHRKARAHYLAAKRHARMNTWLGVPVVITSTIVGTTIFATLSRQPDIAWRILAGLLSLAAAVLAALQTFFRHGEIADKHRMAAAGYAAAFRSLDLFRLQLGRSSNDEDQVIQELETHARELDKLERESPDIPDILYDQAVKEQRGDVEGV